MSPPAGANIRSFDNAFIIRWKLAAERRMTDEYYVS